jgi:hypothetical protein
VPYRGGLAVARYIVGMCGRATYKLTWEEIVRLYQLTLFGVTSADAKGCIKGALIKGALIGGVAGHYAGHHGLLGAASGCIIGRHEAKRRAQLKKDQDQQGQEHSDQPNDEQSKK